MNHLLLYAPDYSDSQTVGLTGPSSAGVANPPLLVANADDPPPPALRLWLYTRPDMDTVDGELTKKRQARWQPQLSETGSATLVIGTDDPELPVDTDQLIAVETYGLVVMSLLPDLDVYSTLSAGGPAAREVTMQCKGSGWVFNEAVIEPTRGAGSLPIQDDRAFGWYVPQFDITGWYSANAITNGLTAWWYGATNWPGGLDGGYGYWIWGEEGSVTYAPAGDCFFRKDFTVTAEQAGTYTVFLLGDDRAHLYFDGQRVLVTGNWTNSDQDIATVDLTISAGDHTIAVWAQNNPGELGNNPSAVRVAVAVRNLDGTVGTPLVASDSTWLCTSYPIYIPGMTPGMMIRILLEEAQARGALTGVTLNFTDWYDSSGAQWMTYNDITTKVGGSMLTFLREMSDTYIDWRMSPSRLELSMWNLDGAGVDTGHSWNPHTDPDDSASGNVRELTQRRQR